MVFLMALLMLLIYYLLAVSMFTSTLQDIIPIFIYHFIILFRGSITLFIECFVALTKLSLGNLLYLHYVYKCKTSYYLYIYFLSTYTYSLVITVFILVNYLLPLYFNRLPVKAIKNEIKVLFSTLR